MHLINYEKLSNKINSTDIIILTVLAVGAITFILIVIDSLINLSLLYFKMLLASEFLFFFIGMWISTQLHNYEMEKMSNEFRMQIQKLQQANESGQQS